jgi:hypothetical protein
MTQTEARPQVPAQVASDGRMDLRQGGSQDAGQDEQDGRQGQAEAHGDGLGELVAVGLGLWSRRIGHYVERCTPLPRARRDDADSGVVGPPQRGWPLRAIEPGESAGTR